MKNKAASRMTPMTTPTPMPAFAPVESPSVWADVEDAVEEPFAPTAVEELVGLAEEVVVEDDEVATTTLLLVWSLEDVVNAVSGVVGEGIDVSEAVADVPDTSEVVASGPKTVENPMVLTTTWFVVKEMVEMIVLVTEPAITSVDVMVVTVPSSVVVNIETAPGVASVAGTTE